MLARYKMSTPHPRNGRGNAQADAALLASEARFRSLTELSSDWYWEQDAELRFTLLSEGFFQRSSMRPEDFLGKQRWECSVGLPLNSTWEAHRATLEARLPFRNFEFERFEADGARRFQAASGHPVFDAHGAFVGYRGTGRDITARVLAEQKLREQSRLLTRAQELAGLGYWEYETSSGFISGSRELRRMLQIDSEGPGQALEGALDFVDPQDRETVRGAIRSAIERDKSFDLEARVTTAGGRPRIMIISGEAVKDATGNISKVIGSCLDISERRARENALSDAARELQALSRRLVEAQETERRHLAAELHDQVGQNLTALSINLDILANRLDTLEGVAEAKRRVGDSLALLDATSHCIEGVLDDLRPPMLDDWGIGPTLRWVAEEFARRTEIPAPVRVLGAERRIDPKNELALVRIAQEALNNVAKHAQARRVEILLRWESASVSVEVADNGIGFDTSGSGGRKGLGLLSMRERTQALDGELEIESAPGRGTCVRVRVPS